MSSALSLLWILLLLASFAWPVFQQRRLHMARIELLRQMERARKSRVITLIHRQEAVNILGIPIARFIDIEDSEQILRVIRLTPPDTPIDLILHTPGGLVLATEQIALALQRHPGEVTVLVPHYAMSGGTLLALAADRVLMDENAVLGPVDPQVGQYPATSVLRVLREKGLDHVEDRTLILADIAEKAVNQVRDTVSAILAKKMDPGDAAQVARALTEGNWTHDYPLTLKQLKGLGLPVEAGLPREVYLLMDLYPQPRRGRPSVLYAPLPYRDDDRLG